MLVELSQSFIQVHLIKKGCWKFSTTKSFLNLIFNKSAIPPFADNLFFAKIFPFQKRIFAQVGLQPTFQKYISS